MEKLISSASLKTDQLAQQLIEHLETNEQRLGLENAILYYGFPLFRDYDYEIFRPTVLLLDKVQGITAIKIVGTTLELTLEDEGLDQFHSMLFGRLLNSRKLRRGKRDLALDLNMILYAPGGDGAGTDPEELNSELCFSLQGLDDVLGGEQNQELTDEQFAEVRSIVEGVRALVKPVARDVPSEQNRADILRALETEVSNFDISQRKAAISVTSGPQRIRGLAGSGKTIVLAWKAAYFHLENPDHKILFTFYTKSLYDTIRRQITKFYRHFRDVDPNWDNLHIMHAWGGRNVEGVYYNACLDNDVVPKNFADLKNVVDPFGVACAELITKVSVKPAYDHVFIDEAQDFPNTFFQLCFFLAKGERDSKSLIWAYDELQSIFDVRTRTPAELFGKDKDGSARMDLTRAAAASGLERFVSNDVVLEKSYRNPREILVCSHALGFGLYGPKIVQMLDGEAHWQDVGYEVTSGKLEKGQKVEIFRPEKNSPLSINRFQSKSELLELYAAADFKDEIRWVVDAILSDLAAGLRPDDIMVISLDERNARTYFKALGNQLSENDVSVHDMLSNPFGTSRFSVDGHVTLSTVFRAKGNEAASVICIGVDSMAAQRATRKGRNKLFTAFTRTRAWLRVSGMKPSADLLISELATALQNAPYLKFTFPDLGEIDTIQRDLSKREERIGKLRAKWAKDLEMAGLTEEEMAVELTAELKK
ncbi:hypothetical protein C265_17292 [Cupriavidus sp. GA3-3]|uniref:DEAD/DEAH box helicase n=1 Tax=Cupriavidus sp. GA3-3 TaxID=1229514 RepID=UPI00032F549D|nr:ATP-binding domain-containing protein [Cupriavidus sp. GA3-3]EON18470.1 hypothetical protein C265_17292 [Cupriavidus sp. GA3-3]